VCEITRTLLSAGLPSQQKQTNLKHFKNPIKALAFQYAGASFILNLLIMDKSKSKKKTDCFQSAFIFGRF
jgi:hypothetical protein